MSIVMKNRRGADGRRRGRQLFRNKLVITPDPEPPPEASSDGSRNPSPPEPSGDGSEPEQQCIGGTSCLGASPEVNDGTALPKPNRQTLPDWRRDPENMVRRCCTRTSAKRRWRWPMPFSLRFSPSPKRARTHWRRPTKCRRVSRRPRTQSKKCGTGSELEAENARLNATLRDQTRSEARAETEAI